MINVDYALERWVRHADADAFAELVRAYRPMVLGICQRLLGNTQMADDAMQETFLLLARQAFTIRSNLGSWLYTCALNEARRQWRVQQRSGTAVTARTVAVEHLAELDEDEHVLLHQCIADLDDRDRDVISLHFFLGMPQARIGERYGISQPAVVKRLDRALRSLRLRILSRGLRLQGLFETSVPRFTSAFDWRMASLLIAVGGYGLYTPASIRQTYHLIRAGDIDPPTREHLQRGLLATICLLLTREDALSGQRGGAVYRCSAPSRGQRLADLVMDAIGFTRELVLMTGSGVRALARRLLARPVLPPRSAA